MQILLIEDNQAHAMLAEEALLECTSGYTLHVVPDGMAGLAFLRRERPYENANPPDLILLDLNLPRLDGREFLRERRDDKSLNQVPVLVLTTSDHPRDIRDSYELGANCYIKKPFEFGDLVRVMSQIDLFWSGVALLPPRSF